MTCVTVGEQFQLSSFRRINVDVVGVLGATGLAKQHDNGGLFAAASQINVAE